MSVKSFTLYGVKKSLCKPLSQTGPIKIAKKSEKKKGGKIATKETNEGYTLNIAYTGHTDFMPDEHEDDVRVCWWDHHPYDGPRVRIPYKHERIVARDGSMKHKFHGPGSFCDIFCLWSYLAEEARKIPQLRDVRLDLAIQNTKVAFSLMFPPTVILKERPDWRLLNTYGGHLTIENYRNGTYTKTFIKTPEVVFEGALVQYLTQ
jgi:hypothetical protein